MRRRLIDDPRLDLSPTARHDLASGLVKPGLVDILGLLVERHRISVSLVKTGHPLGPVTPGGRRNDHYFYCALDIDAVDGLPVEGYESEPGLVAVGRLLMSLPYGRRAHLVMGPARWHQVLGDGDVTGFRHDDFADRIHADHLHIGVAEPARPARGL